MVKRKKYNLTKVKQFDTLAVHAGVKADPQTGARQSVVRATANVSPKRTFANDGVGKFMQQLQQAENFFGQFDHYAGSSPVCMEHN